jgi:predicted AAA+ superfamily ATPase
MVSKDLLREILLEQSNKAKLSEGYKWVEREALVDVKRFFSSKQAVVLTGVRRCGKSVLLSEIMQSYKSFYYVNFEDERLSGFGILDFNLLYEVCLELFGKSNTFFLDEVQSVAGWEKWVRRMHDDGFKFFITGSNAHLLSKELGTLLTGRHLQFSLYPFSFREFLKLRKIDFKKEDVYLTEKRAVLTKAFNEFVWAGGFPEYLEDSKTELLQEYFNSIIQRDVVERYRVKNVQIIKNLARHLITNSGKLTTYNQLKTITESKSANTAINYVSYLENAYLVFRVPFFSYSLKKQSANAFKVFAIDAGLRNAMGFTFSSDTGRLFETIVALQLKRQNKEVYYWKNYSQQEVDFVIKEGKKVVELMQVCHTLTDPIVKRRELTALLKAGAELKCNNYTIITHDYEAEEKTDGNKFNFIPLWKWLLKE